MDVFENNEPEYQTDWTERDSPILEQLPEDVFHIPDPKREAEKLSKQDWWALYDRNMNNLDKLLMAGQMSVSQHYELRQSFRRAYAQSNPDDILTPKRRKIQAIKKAGYSTLLVGILAVASLYLIKKASR